MSHEEIAQAFRKRALLLHPDKRPKEDVEKATREFQELKISHDELKKPESRRKLDNMLLDREEAHHQEEREEREVKEKCSGGHKFGKSRDSAEPSDVQEEKAQEQREEEGQSEDGQGQEGARRAAKDKEERMEAERVVWAEGLRKNTVDIGKVMKAVPEGRVLEATWDQVLGSDRRPLVEQELRDRLNEFGEIDLIVVKPKKALIMMVSRDSACTVGTRIISTSWLTFNIKPCSE